MIRPGGAITAAAIVLAASIATACGPAGAGPGGDTAVPLRVAAASDLRFAMDELVAGWTAANPDHPVDVVYGSSGTFFAQISSGGPFDLFFSADAAYPRDLEAAGFAAAGSTRPYAAGRIVTWVPAESSLDVEGLGIGVLADPSVTTVAIANPDHAPYGRAAIAALANAGVLETVRPKLVLGENVSQAAQFVESGSADAGIIALSLALAPELRDHGRYAIVPLEAHPPLDQAALVLDTATDPGAARAFLDYVLGPDGRAVLGRYGFELPAP